MIRLLAPLLLMSCTTLVPSTVAQLAQTDPLTANPAAIRLAVTLPGGLSVTRGTALLTLSAKRGAETVADDFTLVQTDGSDGMQVFALSSADVLRMRALQSEIAQWKAQGAGQGALGLGIGGCAVGSGPAPDARGSASIRLAADGPFLPLIRDAPLSQLIGAKALASIPPCEGPT
ncbi:MAG: hypothetical protein ACRC14_18360 [Paracoccaceae bacterium]